MPDAKRKAIIFFILAFAMAALASGIVINEWNNIRASWGKTVKVAVAKQDILPYTAITPEMIDWSELPQQFVSDNFITDETTLTKSITIVEVKKGDFFTPSVIRAHTELAPDERIVWLNFSNNVFLDQMVAPGDRVDLIVTYQDENRLVTKRLFTGIPVIQRETIDEGKIAVKVVLPLNEAERLIYYQNTAEQIRVLLSNQVERPLHPDDEKGQASGSGEPPAVQTPAEEPEQGNRPETNNPVIEVGSGSEGGGQP